MQSDLMSIRTEGNISILGLAKEFTFCLFIFIGRRSRAGDTDSNRILINNNPKGKGKLRTQYNSNMCCPLSSVWFLIDSDG